jgi:hypothetical protein
MVRRGNPLWILTLPIYPRVVYDYIDIDKKWDEAYIIMSTVCITTTPQFRDNQEVIPFYENPLPYD